MKKKEQKKTERITLPLLPLRDIVVFPHMIIPLFVGRECSIKALDHAMATDRKILLAAQKKAKKNDPLPEEIHEIGTTANVLQILKQSDGTVKVLIEGIQRAKIESFLENSSFFEVTAVPLKIERENSVQTAALMRSANSIFEQYSKLNQRVPLEVVKTLNTVSEPDNFADTLAAQLDLKTSEKQELLETINPKGRLEKLIDFMLHELEILRIEKKVRNRVKRQMEKSQKEYYLSEQIRALQKELGKGDEKSEIQELAEKIKKAGMPKEVYEKAQKELKRLELMPPMSAEGTVIRNYVAFFVSFTKGIVEEILNASNIIKATKGEIVVTEGEIDDSFFIILSGRAAVHKDDKKIAFIGRGECFGEMSYLSGQARTATVTADTDTVLMKISATLLDRASESMQLIFLKNFALTLVKRLSQSIKIDG